MSSAEVVAAVMFSAVVLYAVLGGADFGSGIWDLMAGGPKRGAPTRKLIDHAIGPVWEANHVWLIFVLVFLLTAFPVAFAALMRTLAVPFWLVGLGIVLRGASFAFRKYAPSFRWARISGITFALSSLITPFFLGTIAGAIASGRVDADAPDSSIGVWLSPTSLVGGVLAVMTCAFLAGVYLVAEADALGNRELTALLRSRALIMGGATGVVALIGVLPLRNDASTLFDGLTGRAAPLVAVSGLAGLTTLYWLRTNAYRRARLSATAAVGSVVAGWGVAQYPWILVDELSIEDAAGARNTMVGLLIASVLAAVLVIPPLIYLFVLADRNRVGSA